MANMYILQTAKGLYYIGSTSNLRHRLLLHHHGKVKTTKSALPVTLVYTESFASRGEAQKREYEIKKWKNKKRIQDLIRMNQNKAPSSIG